MIKHLRKIFITYACSLRDSQRLLASQPDRNEKISFLIETLKFRTVGAVECGRRREAKNYLKVKAREKERFHKKVFVFRVFIIYLF